MRIGQVIGIPDEYTRFGRILGGDGVGYTIDPGELAEDVSLDDEMAYKVDIWENDSGLAYRLEDH